MVKYLLKRSGLSTPQRTSDEASTAGLAQSPGSQASDAVACTTSSVDRHAALAFDAWRRGKDSRRRKKSAGELRRREVLRMCWRLTVVASTVLRWPSSRPRRSLDFSALQAVPTGTTEIDCRPARLRSSLVARP